MTFGAQSPPLTEQIASILRRYPDGGQILKVRCSLHVSAKYLSVSFIGVSKLGREASCSTRYIYTEWLVVDQ